MEDNDNDMALIIIVGALLGAAAGGYFGWKWHHWLGLIVGILGGGFLLGILAIPLLSILGTISNIWNLVWILITILLFAGFFILMPVSFGFKGILAITAMLTGGFLLGLILPLKWWSGTMAVVAGIGLCVWVVGAHAWNNLDSHMPKSLEFYVGLSFLLGFLATPVMGMGLGNSLRDKWRNQ